MTDEAEREGQPDPRQEKFQVDIGLLTEDQLDGLIDEYCTRYHGLNDQENPLVEAAGVRAAVDSGELVVWFDPVTNTASLDRPQAQR
jgi:uncharacterized protein YheU (UPF0270 family)